MGTGQLVNAQATLTTVFSKTGSFTIAATYSGDANYISRTSSPLTQVVQGIQALTVEPNAKCNAKWGPCSGNIVLANGTETTNLVAVVKPAQQSAIALTASFGQVSNITTGSSGIGTGVYTAGSLTFGWTDTTTSPGNVNGTIGGQQFPSLTQIFNYDAFNFHQSQVTDAEFTASNTMSAGDIQSFLVKQNSFLSQFVIISTQGGFIDQNGNGQLDKGETVYVSNPAQECKAPCRPFQLGATGTLASGVFMSAASTYGLNPEVLLATAEKENSLIRNPKFPIAVVLNFAMGCGKPSDFLSQLNCAANTFVYQFQQDPSEPFFLKQPTFNIEHYVTGIGRTKVAFQVQDAATYSQYRYTPFIQTSATGGGVYLFEYLWSVFGF